MAHFSTSCALLLCRVGLGPQIDHGGAQPHPTNSVLKIHLYEMAIRDIERQLNEIIQKANKEKAPKNDKKGC